MIKKIELLAALIGLCWIPAVVTAASGKAFVPTYFAQDASGTSGDDYLFVSISNISHADVNVTVKFFDKNGIIITDGDNSPSSGSIQGQNVGVNWNDNPDNASLVFVLSPRNTERVQLFTPTKNIGYGLIEWQQNGEVPVSIVAHAYYMYYKSGAYMISNFSIPVNGGMPF